MRLPYKKDNFLCPAWNAIPDDRIHRGLCNITSDICEKRNYGDCKVYREQVKPIRDQLKREITK